MDRELEDLESIFSDHFGRTPSASQASDAELEEIDGSNDDDLLPDEDNRIDIDQRAQDFIEANHTDLNDVGGEDEDLAAVYVDCDPDLEAAICFKQSGCGCQRNCTEHMSVSDMHTHILNVREMDKADKEMYIMASLVENTSKETTKRGKKRQRSSHDFIFKGTRVCKKTFMMVFDVGKHCLQNLMRHVNEAGVVPRTHKNTGKKPSKALTFEDIKQVIQFISNVADEVGLPQPAAPPGRDGTAPIYLPSDTTKVTVHKQYAESCLQKEPAVRVVKYSTFNNIWRSCLSHVKIASPRDDVCATCERLKKQVQDAVSEEEKLDYTDKLRQHVLTSQRERETYNTCIRRARQTHDDDEAETYVHYTFDFSQNVCLPHHSRQMGPVYFTSLRKQQIFGFRIDAIPIQLNFLIDENETIGQDGTCTHGPNSVISMIHWAMETRYNGESACAIHADNCPGQNKNKYVIGYLLWRVMTGKHETIEYMMQVPGHARCLVDSGFACIKKLYRRTDCDSLDQLEEVVNKSSITNVAVRYPAWQWYDWKSFLEPIIKPLKGIRKYQYFRMTADRPGVVVVKTGSDAEEKEISVLKPRAQFPDHMPVILPAAGLSRQRQTYLYKTVRPFVRPQFQDSVCPPPTADIV